MTVADALRQTARRLRAATGEEAAQEARWLVGHVLGLQPAELAASRLGAWRPEQAAALERLLQRRLMGEPLQYILGEWAFMGLPMRVRPGVLIPRADTEILAERAVQRMRQRGYRTALDLCCGSGCIGIALARFCAAEVTATDLSPACCALARENAAQNGVQLDVRQGDLFDAVKMQETFDIIACNPPYLDASDLAGLQREVTFEPRLALDGGPDGLDFYRRIAAAYRVYLRPGGTLLLEIGSTQAQPVASLFGGGELLHDYAGRPRVLEVCEARPVSTEESGRNTCWKS